MDNRYTVIVSSGPEYGATFVEALHVEASDAPSAARLALASLAVTGRDYAEAIMVFPCWHHDVLTERVER